MRKVKFISFFRFQLAVLVSRAHTVFDVVVDDEVQFLPQKRSISKQTEQHDS